MPVVVSDSEGHVVSLNVAVTVQGEADTDNDGLSDRCETAFGLNPSSNADHVSAGGDFDGDGATNLQECNAGTHPRGFFARYFAEGATSTFFATRFAVANTRVDPIGTLHDLRHDGHVLFRFQRDDGVVITAPMAIGSGEQRTIDVGGLAGLASAAFSTVVESISRSSSSAP